MVCKYCGKEIEYSPVGPAEERLNYRHLFSKTYRCDGEVTFFNAINRKIKAGVKFTTPMDQSDVLRALKNHL